MDIKFLKEEGLIIITLFTFLHFYIVIYTGLQYLKWFEHCRLQLHLTNPYSSYVTLWSAKM